jgi:hypothetical protein
MWTCLFWSGFEELVAERFESEKVSINFCLSFGYENLRKFSGNLGVCMCNGGEEASSNGINWSFWSEY